MSIYRDDHHGFDRPKRRTRPRTKDRPDYSGLPVAHVVGIDRGRFRCRIGDDVVTAVRGRLIPRKGVVIGDRVRLDGDVSATAGTLARIVQVEPRSTMLHRSADDADTFERPIVANATQLLIVTALADPPPRLGMIDRILVAAYDAGIVPILCLTKADLASPDDLISAYEPLGIPIVATKPQADLTHVEELLADQTTVLIGHSGVGKSTLVNRLVPGADRETGAVSELTGKGRHTSTSAVAMEVKPGTWIIDTPGVRSFGISHVDSANIIGAFPDLADFAEQCPRGCTHVTGSPECGLDLAVERGSLAPERLASFRRMERAFV
ncbi:ribosome small subunit-dependent GTPase A [Tessaracoccus sp. OH4464_COT-324]|uniref:ribosome small subunit-dependent GTPase A n=1 Tax=Tessaracoccus sp. OH4464_COT-324 TaxID=2491059 RepID=UPI000F62EEB0|nr:ribosome small subunit-dependent GTPase A [Tessaracoccus sp. OH4464_COT-324]RRD47864.1 ribosome small subunit-dependent GTPase A [Tessaracoccus sp. OH4464_COT-324]